MRYEKICKICIMQGCYLGGFLTAEDTVSHPSDQEKDGQRERWRPKIVRQPGERRDREVHTYRERQQSVSKHKQW